MHIKCLEVEQIESYLVWSQNVDLCACFMMITELVKSVTVIPSYNIIS